MKAWMEPQEHRLDDIASGGNTGRRIRAKMPSFATCLATFPFPRRTLINRVFFVGVFVLTMWIPSKAQEPNSAPRQVANFVDAADKAGLKLTITFGGKSQKKYIIETTGTGVAIFDYDNDGWPDIFVVNGTTLEGSAKGKEPTSHLFHNNHDGTFTDVSAHAGITNTGWGQGACVGDYDNDGWDDLYVTYYGKNLLYHNERNGTFKEVGDVAGVSGSGKDWGSGCAFVDYDRDGKLDLIVANYVEFRSGDSPQARRRCFV